MKLITLFIFVILVVSCGNNNNRFFEIDQLNEGIKTKIGIDLHKIERKLNKKLDDDPNYYADAMKDFIIGMNSDIFQQNGLLKVRDNGDTLEKKNEKNLMISMFESWRECLILEDCVSNATDSTCITKKSMEKWLTAKIETQDTYIDYFQLGQRLEKLYLKKHITEKEFNFMVIYVHLLLSIDALNNRYYTLDKG